MIKINKWKNYKENVFSPSRCVRLCRNNVYYYLEQDFYFAGSDSRRRQANRHLAFGEFLQTSYGSRSNPFLKHPFYI